MRETRRTRQVGDVVRAELARLIREELRDPAIGFATITDVEMSPDLRNARVFVSVLGADYTTSVAALNHAAGKLRGAVGRGCALRHAPELHFVEDRTLERGARVEELLRRVREGSPGGSDPRNGDRSGG